MPAPTTAKSQRSSTGCTIGGISAVKDAGTAGILAYTAAELVLLWGTAHVIPTKAVVSGFGDLFKDNRWVLVTEWVAEALAMWFVAVLVIAVTVSAVAEAAADLVYRLSAGFLVVVGAWTVLTGARSPVVGFKPCGGGARRHRRPVGDRQPRVEPRRRGRM